jgi:hypothetical protein
MPQVWQPEAIINYGSQYLFELGPCNVTVPTEYDPALSSTSVVISNHSSEYAYGGNSKILQGGNYANDTLTAINSSGPIPNVQFALENFGIIRQLDNGSCVEGVTYDKAILGLSPYTNTTQGPSFRRDLYDTGKVTTKAMVMWFDKHLGSLGRLTGGVLFGAIDTSKYTGPLVQVPNLIEQGEIGFYVPKPTVTFNGHSFTPDQNVTCLIDSGTHADYLPFGYDGNATSEFFSASGLINYNGVVVYNGPCESIPQNSTMGYTFPGVNTNQSITIDVPLRNYARGSPNFNESLGDVCFLNMEIDGCIFGAPFLSGAFLAVDDEDGLIALAQGGVCEEGSGLDVDSLRVFEPGETFDTV